MDTQLCLMAPFLTALLINRPKMGLFVLLSFVCFSITGTAVQIVKQSLPPVPLFYINSIHFIQTLKTYIFDLYFLPMQHVSAFAIGSGTAVFVHNNPKIYMRNWLAVIGWIVSFGTKFALLFAVYPWNSGSSVPSPFTSALYGSTCRTIWSLTHCWDFIAASTGYGGNISSHDRDFLFNHLFTFRISDINLFLEATDPVGQDDVHCSHIRTNPHAGDSGNESGSLLLHPLFHGEQDYFCSVCECFTAFCSCSLEPTFRFHNLCS